METEPERNKKDLPKILILDDISMNVEILDNIITHEGYETMCALSVKEALELIKESKPSMILSDLSMPEVDGLEFCRMMKNSPATRDIPFVFISVMDSSEEKKRAFLTGAVDFIPKPFDPIEVIMRVRNHLNTHQLRQEMADYNRRMHKLLSDQKLLLSQEQKNAVLAIVEMMETKYPGLKQHLENVAENCRLLAQGLQFVPEYENEISDEFIENIGFASMLHDIGACAFSDSEMIFNGRLAGSDHSLLAAETEAAKSILHHISEGQNAAAFSTMAYQIASYRYANWDGSGYPEVHGKLVPLEARIAAVAGDFDDLIRPEKEGGEPDVEAGFSYISAGSGTFYEPEIVEVMNKLRRRLKIYELPTGND